MEPPCPQARANGAPDLVTDNQNHRRRNSPMQNRHIIFTAIFSALTFLYGADAVEPAAPDLAGGNTAFGQNALRSLTTGLYNTAIGFDSVLALTDASFDTGVGAGTLLLDTGGTNTAVGAAALLNNQIASDNNAVGAFALFNNDSSGMGLANFNNAHGRNALLNNVDGDENDAFGDDTMEENTTGSRNTAMGDDALDGNTTGNGNTAMGKEAGNSIIDGNDNVVLGHNAGIGIVHASRNIAMGSGVSGPFADFDDTCFIGSIFGEIVSDPCSQTAVFVDQFNVVGIFNSSRSYKHDIQPMDKTSETLYRLKPVTFKFNSDWKGTTQYGLIAEDVAEVDPQLVSRKGGDIVTVHYEQINAMLLNEFLKEHCTVQEQKATIARLKSTDAEQEVTITQLKSSDAKQEAIIAKQQKQIEALTVELQKMSAQIEMSKSTPRVALNNP
jgi:trimeric autotransporter adhesin